MAFKIALCTRDFMQRIDAFRRIAPIVCLTGKNRFQFLCADPSQEVERLIKSFGPEGGGGAFLH